MTNRRADFQIPAPPPYQPPKPRRTWWEKPLTPVLAYREYLRREPEGIAWGLLHNLLWEIVLTLKRIGVNALLPDPIGSRIIRSRGDQVDAYGTVEVDRSHVSVIEVCMSVPKSFGDAHRSIPQTRLSYVIQDPRIGPGQSSIQVQPKQTLRETLTGSALSVDWEGEAESALITHLTADTTIRLGILVSQTSKVASHVADLTITAEPDHPGWVITTAWRPEELTLQRWSAYEKIGGYLREASKAANRTPTTRAPFVGIRMEPK